MNELHVKHHFVPKCYLKRWENTNRKVFVYRTLVEHPNIPVWGQQFPSEIGYQEHLYTQILTGIESDNIETWLDREFESPANKSLDKATTDGRLTRDDWATLIDFLAAQDVRTPARLFEHLLRTQKELPDVLQAILDESNMDVALCAPLALEGVCTPPNARAF